MKNIVNTLEERGFIDAMTSSDLREIVTKPIKVYAGFDPTSDSLHLGNLIGIMGLAWMSRFGHTPIAIVGGATGMIGDPSGKSQERNLLDQKTIERNLLGIRHSIESVLKQGVTIMNNYEWFRNFGYIDFLREIGKHFRMGIMLSKDSVKSRLASDEGMSYTEFSYQMLQAYDFLHLFDTHNVTLQIGGSDQWGNIVAGTELVRKVRGVTVYGLTFPLLTRSDGKKFGKTEEGAVWLNPERLSAYDFYQYIFRLPDADMSKMFRMLTFLEMEEIRDIENEMKQKNYAPNTAQKRLASEVTKIVHGEEGLKEALRVTEAAKPGSHTKLDHETLKVLAQDIPSKTFQPQEVMNQRLLDLLVITGMLGSKGEARRMIAAGGIYLNNEKVADEHLILGAHHFIEGNFLLVSVGKKKKMVIKIA